MVNARAVPQFLVPMIELVMASWPNARYHVSAKVEEISDLSIVEKLRTQKIGRKVGEEAVSILASNTSIVTAAVEGWLARRTGSCR